MELNFEQLRLIREVYMFPGDLKDQLVGLGVPRVDATAMAFCDAVKSGDVVKFYRDYGQPHLHSAKYFDMWIEDCLKKIG